MHPKFDFVNSNGNSNFRHEKSLMLVYKILVSKYIYMCLVLHEREFHCKSHNV